jgi:hypothetical protein
MSAESSLGLDRQEFINPPSRVASVALSMVDGRSELVVDDPIVAADPTAYDEVRAYVATLEQEIQEDGFDTLVERQSDHPYGASGGRGDLAGRGYTPYTERWLKAPGNEAMAAWRSLVPHASALDYLNGIQVGDPIIGRSGQPTKTTASTAAQLRYVDDAVGIRVRAAAMRWKAEEYLRGRAWPLERRVRWLSLACGTAGPSLDAADQIRSSLGASFELHALDYDETALAMVERRRSQHDSDHIVRAHKGDLLGTDFAAELRSSSGFEHFDVVEDLGFKEYLPEETDSLGAFKRLDDALPQASDFTRRAWELVAPGGILISGNMLLDRPQRDYVFGVVAWPIINARSHDELLDVYRTSGILDDQLEEFEIYTVRERHSAAAVYALAVARKAA